MPGVAGRSKLGLFALWVLQFKESKISLPAPSSGIQSKKCWTRNYTQGASCASATKDCGRMHQGHRGLEKEQSDQRTRASWCPPKVTLARINLKEAS